MHSLCLHFDSFYLSLYLSDNLNTMRSGIFMSLGGVAHGLAQSLRASEIQSPKGIYAQSPKISKIQALPKFSAKGQNGNIGGIFGLPSASEQVGDFFANLIRPKKQYLLVRVFTSTLYDGAMLKYTIYDPQNQSSRQKEWLHQSSLLPTPRFWVLLAVFLLAKPSMPVLSVYPLVYLGQSFQLLRPPPRTWLIQELVNIPQQYSRIQLL